MASSADPYGAAQPACLPAEHLSKAGKPGARKNCATNPRCLFGLGEHREGIWADQTKKPCEAFKALGDPGDEGDPAVTPLGLRNLGATCYVNSLLQTLFFNDHFRRDVYRWRPKDPAIETSPQALQRLFCELELSSSSIVDPSPLTRLLNLQTGVQQDAQEFNRLLLQHLETEMDPQITNQFLGSISYETVCSHCSFKSTQSSNFYELELVMKPTVDEAIQSLSQPDILCGVNQYACDACQCKRDAVRRTVIESVPQVLCLQLLRFVFNATSMAKLKLKDQIEIPYALEVKGVLFDLVAIMYHRGTSAHAGHYVADVLDVHKGTWWTFNDGVVEPAPPLDSRKKPFKSNDAYMIVYRQHDLQSVDASAKSWAPEALVKAVEEANAQRREDRKTYDAKRSSLLKEIEARKRLYSSLFEGKPATGSKNGASGSSSSKKSGSNGKEEFWVPVSWFKSWVLGDSVPSSSETSSISAAPSSSTAATAATTTATTAATTAATATTTSSSSLSTTSAAVIDLTLSTPSWHPSLHPGPVASKAFLCPHGKLDPTKAKDAMKIVSGAAWAAMATDGFDVALPVSTSSCDACLSRVVDRGERVRREMEQLKNLDAVLSLPQVEVKSSSPGVVETRNGGGNGSAAKRAKTSVDLGELVFVSRTWLKSLQSRVRGRLRELKVANEGITAGGGDDLGDDVVEVVQLGDDVDANKALICKHNSLLPGSTRDRKVVRRSDFDALVTSADEGRWIGSTMFEFNTTPCSQCMAEGTDDKQAKQRIRQEARALLSEEQVGPVLTSLLNRQSQALTWPLPQDARLVPRSFLRRVLLYLDGRLDHEPFASFGEIEIIFGNFKCSAHRFPVIAPAIRKWLASGVRSKVDDGDDELEDYDGPVSSQLNVSQGASMDIVWEEEWLALAQVLKLEGRIEPQRVAASSTAPGDPSSFSPEFCSTCQPLLEQAWEDAQSNFKNKPVFVTRLGAGMKPPISNEAPSSPARASRRSVRNKAVALLLSSSDHAQVVREKIVAKLSLKCAASRLRLFHKGSLIENGLPLSVLDVKVGGDIYFDLGPDDDLELALAESLQHHARQGEEKGFSGSALLRGSNKPSSPPEVVDVTDDA